MENNNRFLKVVKKYAFEGLACLLIFAIALTVILINNSDKNTTSLAANPVISVSTSALTLTLPMLDATILKDYSESELQWNGTLGWYEAHFAVDLTSTNTDVYAIANGTVLSCEQDYLKGNIITISHANGLTSVYSSLTDVLVEAGDVVALGDKIASAGITASAELSDGNHLHFELLDNGQNIDPSNYLTFENK